MRDVIVLRIEGLLITLDDMGGSARIVDVARDCGVTTAYAGRLLRMLVPAGLITTDGAGTYSLTRPLDNVKRKELLRALGREPKGKPPVYRHKPEPLSLAGRAETVTRFLSIDDEVTERLAPYATECWEWRGVFVPKDSAPELKRIGRGFMVRPSTGEVFRVKG